MNYSPEAIDRIAAGYALGTLRGPARRRFERLCETLASVDAVRNAWQERLAALADRARAVDPAPGTWPAILRRLDLTQPGAQSGVLAFPQPRARKPFWQQFAVAASLAVLAGSLGWFMAQQSGRLSVSSAALSALVTDQGGRPLWRVTASAEGRRLNIAVVEGETVADDRSLELWALPRNGGAPVSLGLVPRTRAVSVALLEPQRLALLSADKLAVSLEPRGGSPTGAPTGPVLHVADLSRS